MLTEHSESTWQRICFRFTVEMGKRRTVVQRQLRRRQLMPFVAQLQPCLVAMEACGGAHHIACEIARHDHVVMPMRPRLVRPYVKSNKNDAQIQPKCVFAKFDAPFDAHPGAEEPGTAIHARAASGCGHPQLRERTALMNQLRGLSEGRAMGSRKVAQGDTPLRVALALIMEDRENGTSELIRELLAEMSSACGSIRGALETVRRIAELPALTSALTPSAWRSRALVH